MKSFGLLHLTLDNLNCLRVLGWYRLKKNGHFCSKKVVKFSNIYKLNWRFFTFILEIFFYIYFKFSLFEDYEMSFKKPARQPIQAFSEYALKHGEKIVEPFFRRLAVLILFNKIPENAPAWPIITLIEYTL